MNCNEGIDGLCDSDMKEGIRKVLRIIADIAKYVLIGGICGVALNLLIMHSPIPRMFPVYTESFVGKLYSIDIISGFFLYCLVAPVLEELIFRIGIYGFLYKRLGFAVSAIMSSGLFAVYHMNMVQGIYAFIMGMLFCTLYHRDHRIPVPILLHAGANLAVWLLC